MKKIELKKPESPDKSTVYKKHKLYNVYLVKHTYYFTNKKDAEKFVAETNKFLNQILHDVNFRLIEVYRMYRLAWFYFADSSHGVNRMYLDRKIESELRNTETFLHRLIFNTKGYSATDFIFTFLRNSIDCIDRICSWLITVYAKRSEHANVYILENIQAGNKLNIEKIESYLEKSFAKNTAMTNKAK